MRTKSLYIFSLGVALGLVACSEDDPGNAGSGGSTTTTGGSGPSSGGATSGGSTGNPSGGSLTTSGGASPGTGGATTSGGSGTGGSGNTSSGGATTGGSASGGTNNGNGGTSNGGNSAGGSGNTGNGGASKGGTGSGGTSNGGASSGGKSASGGTGNGGASSGGKSASGGSVSGGASSGGSTGSGGGITSNCAEGQKTISNNETGKHCGYTYEYWKDSGSGSLVLKPDGFSVDWSGINNLLGRKGIRPGSASLVATYEADYKPNGNSYLCIYGWSKSPLIEYYIVDSWGNFRPPGNTTSMGTVTSDGGTYDIYRTQRVNQPSIEGTQTFYQFWSVRTAKRTSGTITVQNHVSAWAAKGMNLGSFYEVSMTVEGYQSSGSASVKMSIK